MASRKTDQNNSDLIRDKGSLKVPIKHTQTNAEANGHCNARTPNGCKVCGIYCFGIWKKRQQKRLPNEQKQR